MSRTHECERCMHECVAGVRAPRVWPVRSMGREIPQERLSTHSALAVPVRESRLPPANSLRSFDEGSFRALSRLLFELMTVGRTELKAVDRLELRYLL